MDHLAPGAPYDVSLETNHRIHVPHKDVFNTDAAYFLLNEN